MPVYDFEIKSVEPLQGDVYSLKFNNFEPGWRNFSAGQYLEIKVPEMDNCFFSIASAPGHDELEVHMQVTEASPRSLQILNYLESNTNVQIDLAMGECILENLPEEHGPIMLIAAGTGFAQIKSITEDLINKKSERDIHIYWGSKTVTGLYLHELPEQWSNDHSNIHFSAVVSEQSDWQGKQGLLYQAILNDLDSLLDCQAVCCGSTNMVYATLDALVEKGFRKDQMISDVFAFSPREE